ncbi:dermonecrotic toxin domain-containing protein, partial [Salmonella enterica]
VDGQAIVLRPLAFLPKNRSADTQDVVSNMFVIGPQDANAGPCLLYRPMAELPLLQYPSPADLLYAIRQSRHLRDSVLA